MSIIISKAGKNAAKVERTVIEEEDYLQRYIYDNPDTLPLGEIKSDLRLLIVAREFAVLSGYIDALGLDQDGDIYVIETKRYKNPDKRLVIAQMLDYGASLWKSYADPGDFINQLEEYVAKGFGLGLGPKLCEFYGLEPDAVGAYLDTVKQNVSNGVFRFIVLMDRLDDRLKDLISFVNSNSRFDILGVELDFYRHTDFEIIIPRLFGSEGKKEVSSGSGTPKRRWNEDAFFADAKERCQQQTVDDLRSLYDWCLRAEAELAFGNGKETGSFTVKFLSLSPRSLIAVYSSGRIELYFKWLTDLKESAALSERFGFLLKDAGFALPADFAHRYINLKSSDWKGQMEAFIGVIQRLLDERGSSPN